MSKLYQFRLYDPLSGETKETLGAFDGNNLEFLESVIRKYNRRAARSPKVTGVLVVEEVPDSMATVHDPLPN